MAQHTKDCQCDPCFWASVEELVDAEIEADLRRSYRDDFPDFDPSTMPAIPGDFEDVSSHDDRCPRFVHRDLGIELLVDYEDVRQREHPNSNRFHVATPTRSLSTDDWCSAVAFINRIRREAADRKERAANG